MTLLKYIFAILLTIPAALIGWYFYEAYNKVAFKEKKNDKSHRGADNERAKHE